MKKPLTILLTLIVFASWGQNEQPKELGIGFAIANNPYEFNASSIPNNLFKDSVLNLKWTSKNVHPFFYKPDYGLYHFICLEKTKDYYKILVNDTEIGYLPIDTNYYFKTWDAILLKSNVLRITKENPIRQESNDKSKIIENNCEIERLIVEDVIEKDGVYWLQIYFSPNCEDYPNEHSIIKNGWIKWRIDNKLLVEILLLC